MAKINFDFEFSEHLSRADRDPDAAADALLTIAKRLREGQPLRQDIVDHLAGAIESSMVKSQKNRGKALLLELKLTAGSRRPVNVDWYEVGQEFNDSVTSGQSRNSVAEQLSHKHGISESSAVNLWKNYLQHEETISRINAENADQT
jgi:hypothetical protein